MASLKELSEGRTDVYKIDPNKLQIKEGWNSRDPLDPANATHIEELSKSIAEIGVKRPIVVSMEDGVPFITDGHCRYHAVMMAIKNGAEIKTVPVVGDDRYANEADRIFNQIVLNSGKPLTVIEQGKVFKRLIDLGWKGVEIASKAGISGSRVSQILELQTLPVALQRFIVEGKASAAMVLAAFKEHGDNALAVLTGAVEVAEAEGRTRAMPKDTAGVPKVNIKKLLKTMIEKAYGDGNIDDTESLVTVSWDENDWRELLEAIDY